MMTMLDKLNEYLQFKSSYVGSQSSITSMRFKLEPFVRYMKQHDVSEPTYHDIRDWTTYLLQVRKLRESTVSKYRENVYFFFKWCVKKGYATSNPVEWDKLQRLSTKPKERRTFTPDQYRKVLEQARAHKKRYWYPACVMGWSTGLRLSDIALLSWDKVEFSDEILRLVPYKTRRLKPNPIEIPIEPECYDLMVELRDHPEFVSTLVLPYMNGYYIHDRRTLSGEFDTICLKAGMPHHSFHCFRHTFITRMLNAGVDSLIVCAITGLSLNIVQSYAHISMDAKRQAMLKTRLHGLAPPPSTQAA